MGKHRKEDEHDITEISLPSESGPLSLRSHELTPMYRGGPNPNDTDDLTTPWWRFTPLAADPDPKPPPRHRYGQ